MTAKILHARSITVEPTSDKKQIRRGDLFNPLCPDFMPDITHGDPNEVIGVVCYNQQETIEILDCHTDINANQIEYEGKKYHVIEIAFSNKPMFYRKIVGILAEKHQ